MPLKSTGTRRGTTTRPSIICHGPKVEPFGMAGDRTAIPWGVCVNKLPAGRVIGRHGPGAEPTSRKCLPMFRSPTAVAASRRRQRNGLTASLARGGDGFEARDPTIATLRRRPESHVRSVIQLLAQRSRFLRCRPRALRKPTPKGKGERTRRLRLGFCSAPGASRHPSPGGSIQIHPAISSPAPGCHDPIAF